MYINLIYKSLFELCPQPNVKNLIIATPTSEIWAFSNNFHSSEHRL
jgi:hypothetical protein